MEHMIENYYNSPKFREQRTVLEKQGKTKEECLEVIKSNLMDKTKLNENLDTITIHNVKHYFKELSTNNTINEMIEQSFENIFKKTYGNGDIKEAFDKCIKNVSHKKKQMNLLGKIHNDLNKFTKEYIQKYFNNIEFEKQTTDLIRCNLSYIIKKDFGGNISCAIEQCISELYKKQIVDFNVNIDKVRMICIEEGIPFEELLNATFQNIETKMLEQANFIIKTELKLEQEQNCRAMTEYLETIDLQTKININKNIQCEQDITNILATLKELTDKFETLNKNIGKQTIELIKRVIEQNIKKKFDEQLENIISLLLEPKLNKMTDEIDTNHKSFSNFKKGDFKNTEKRLTNIEKDIKEILDKQNKFENELSKLTELESKVNNIENTVAILSGNYQNDIKQLQGDKYNEIKELNLKIDNDISIKNKKIEKLHNIIKDLGNKLNKKYNDCETKYTDEFNKIDNTLKSISKQSVEVTRSNEDLIYKRIDDKIMGKYNKLTSIIPDNVNAIVTKKLSELNHYNVANMTQQFNELTQRHVSTLTQQINDLQGQITMIHQFNQVTFNMPKTYLFR
jgi:hypothetical protein